MESSLTLTHHHANQDDDVCRPAHSVVYRINTRYIILKIYIRCIIVPAYYYVTLGYNSNTSDLLGSCKMMMIKPFLLTAVAPAFLNTSRRSIFPAAMSTSSLVNAPGGDQECDTPAAVIFLHGLGEFLIYCTACNFLLVCPSSFEIRL